MKCIIVDRKFDRLIVQPVDNYNYGDEYIEINTSYSHYNIHNYYYRNLPIGTYITYIRGLINPNDY
jgi:hypothetical protein